MKFCKKCGSELKDDAKFCTNCGTTIDENGEVEEVKQKEGSVSAAPQTETPQNNDKQPSNNHSETIKKAMTLYDRFFWVFFVLTGLAALTFTDLSGSFLYAGRAMPIIFVIISLLTVFAHIACSISRLIVNSKGWKDDAKSQVFDLICFGISALITVKVVLTAISILVKMA